MQTKSNSDLLSRNRRAKLWDYCSRAAYLVTLQLNERIADLSEIPNAPLHVKPWELQLSLEGEVVTESIREFSAINSHIDYEKVRITTYVVMPDHVHLIFSVKDRLEMPLGTYVNKFKSICTRRLKALGIYAEDISFFEKGFNDRVLTRKGQLENWVRYINDNPYRYQLRRMHPDFFQRRIFISIDQVEYEIYGNPFLLRNPEKYVVRHSRKFGFEEQEQRRRCCRRVAFNGGVLVSPFIHPKEREIRDEGLELGGKIILVRHNGFPERFKPSGREFEICAQGRLLIVAPTRYEPLKEKSQLTREHCLHMNHLAEVLASVSDGTALLFRKPYRPR